MKLREKLLCFLICCYMILLPLIPSQINIRYIHLIPNLILLLIIIIYVISSISNSQGRREFSVSIKDFFKDYIGIFFILFFIIMMVSVSFATDKKLALSEGARFLTYIILYFIIKYSIKENLNIKAIINSYIFTLALISVIGLIQYFTGIGLDPAFSFVDKNSVIKYRISGTLENPNNLGAFLVLGLFPIIMLMLKEKIKKIKLIYAVIILIVLFDVVTSYSRNALIGVVIASVALAILYNWKALIAVVGVGGLIFFIPQINFRFLTALNGTVNSDRVKLWRTALEMFKEHPLTGVGNGNYITLYDNYVYRHPELRYMNYSHFPSHNSYLKVLSELGIFGIIVFLALIASSLFKLKQCLNKITDSYYKAFFTGVLASALGFLVMNFSDNMFFIPNTTTYFWIFIALADSLLYKNKTTRGGSNEGINYWS